MEKYHVLQNYLVGSQHQISAPPPPPTVELKFSDSLWPTNLGKLLQKEMCVPSFMKMYQATISV